VNVRPLLFFILWVGVFTNAYGTATFLIGKPGDSAHLFSDEVALVSQMYRDLGVSIKWIDAPTGRSVQLLIDGDLDADLLRTDSPALHNSNVLIVSEPLSFFNIVVYSAIYQSNVEVEQLRGKTFAATRGAFLSTELIERYGLVLVETPTLEAALKMASSKRVDFVVYGERIVDDVLSKNKQLNNVNKVSSRLFKIPVFHVLHRRHRELEPLMSEWLRANSSN